jgi:hypothetical protein
MENQLLTFGDFNTSTNKKKIKSKNINKTSANSVELLRVILV